MINHKKSDRCDQQKSNCNVETTKQKLIIYGFLRKPKVYKQPLRPVI